MKSTKHHLKRAANSLLTYEKINTLLAQIEAFLNSGPLFSISDDPNNLSVLITSQVLIRCSLTALLAKTNTRANRLTHWQHTQQMFQISGRGDLKNTLRAKWTRQQTVHIDYKEKLSSTF